MKQGTKKKLAVITMSTVMAACVAGGVGYAKTNHAVLASADTASYAVLQRTAQSWEGEKFSQNSPLILRLENVAAGQYCVTVKVTAVAGSSEDYYDITATGAGETVFLSMSSAEGEEATFYGVVTVAANGTLTLNTSSANELTANVSLDSLFLSAGNGFYLQDVQIPAATESEEEITPSTLNIDIVNPTAKNFTVQVDLGERRLTEDEILSASIGGVEKQLKRLENTDFNTYSATIEITGNVDVSRLTLSSTSTNVLVGSVSLYQLGAITKIENKTATAENVPVWNTAIFSYTPTQTSYQTVAISSDTKPIYTSTTVSTIAGTYSGTPVAGEDYPVYLQAGTTYYFEVMLSGTDEEGNDVSYKNATLTITLKDWERPTIQVGGAYAIPVTPATENAEVISLQAAAGKYDLTITEVPFDYYFNDVTVTAHITYAAAEGAVPAVQEVVLNSNNNYSAEVTIAENVESIYFTTSQASRSVISISLIIPEVIKTIPLNVETEITIPAKPADAEYGSAIYYLQAADAGIYSIALSAASQDVSVYGDNIAIIPANKTVGGFVVRYDGNDYAIEFRNTGDTEVKLNATVKADTTATLQLNTNNTLTLNAGQRRAYFMYNLGQGDLSIDVTPATGLTLEVDGVPVTLTEGKATITISYVQDTNGVVNFTFENTGAESAEFTVKITPNNIINLNEAFTITTTPNEWDYYYTAYYVQLTADKTYAMALNLPENMSVTVTLNGENFVYYGNIFGTFKATSTGLATLRFNCNVYSQVKSFDLYMTEYTESEMGTMNVGTPNTLTISGYYSQYKLSLAAGMYHLNVTGNVQVAINGTLVANGSTYYSYANEEVIVTVINFTGASATATVTVVPENLLVLGADNNVTIEAGMHSSTYYIDLTADDYTIELTLSDGTSIQVTINGETVVAYGDTEGEFTISAEQAGYVQVTFTTQSDAAVTFTVLVY